MKRHLVRAALACALGTMGLPACGTAATTERVYDGRTVVGPYIEPETYAAYTEGAYHEARGEWALAEAAYRRALSRHGDSAGIWTRLGVIACREGLQPALEAFDAAIEDRAYAPAWMERARCLRAHGHDDLALQAAERAVALDPFEPNSNLLVADVHVSLGQLDRARDWLFAWLLMDPGALTHWREIARRADLASAPDLAELLRARLQAGADSGSELEAASLTSLLAQRRELSVGELEAAILRDDAAAAHLAAGAANMSRLDMARLALSLGKPLLACQEAELLLGADPEDGEAWSLAICSAAMAGDRERLEALLHHGRGLRARRPELMDCLENLLAWWVSDVAASDLDVRVSNAGPPGNPTAP